MATGCYTEPYLDASFRGIPFKAITVTTDFGRRGAEGEFPFSEETAYVDLGRKIRKHRLEARYDQNNHVALANILIQACEQEGPGVLVHPTRGIIVSAFCTALKVEDKIETDGGVTYLSLDFIEAPEWPNGLQTGSRLIIDLADLINTVRSSFLTQYVPASVQAFREDAVVDAAQEQINFVSVQYSAATNSQASDNNRNRVIFDMQTLVEDNSVAAIQSNVDRAIALGMNATAASLSGQAKFDAFRSLANSAAKASTFNSPASNAENSVYNLVRSLSAAYMTQGALEQTEATTGLLLDQAEAVDAVITQEMLYARDACLNPLFLALSEFRSRSASQLASKAYNSPSRSAFSFGGSVHPLWAAYSLYGDAKRHREIETNNVLGKYGRAGPQVVGLTNG